MILRLMIMLLAAFAMPVSAAETVQQIQDSYNVVKDFDTCRSCDNCSKRPPTGAELQRNLQLILNERILTSPQATTPLGLAILQILNSPAIQPPFNLLVSNILTTTGIAGPPGPAGPAGPAGGAGALEFADFYALMGSGLQPNDNPVAVAAGNPVLFPRTGPSNGLITPADVIGAQFNLGNPGVYKILFQVSITAGAPGAQLVVGIDQGSGIVEQAPTVVGRFTSTTQVVGMALVQTTVANAKISIRDPAVNVANSLIISPNAGGPLAVSAHLVILRLQ